MSAGAAGLRLLLALGCTAGTALAQGTSDDGAPYVIPVLSGPVVIDGRVDEPAWSSIPTLPAVMHTPTYEGALTEATEMRVAHDGTYLYLSCRNYDSEPAGIRAPSLERDESGFTNDWCAINLDTFLDRETTLVFGTNPAGIRSEAIFINDAEGSPNFDWNTFWDAAAHRDRRGWYAEIRIPFTSLRFQETDRGVVMGLSVWRLVARKNELHTWPGISPQWGFFSPFKASQTKPVLLRGIQGGNPLYVTPYALGGLGYTHELNDLETAYGRERSRAKEAGLDLKYGLTENLTLDVSVNTDFAQVEADDQQVNLTRFSLFFPEKRAFFQERSNVFDYSLGGSERLFHSRRIGLSGGEPTRIYAGSRIVGRIGEWDVGALSMQSDVPEAGVSSENAGVVRIRRRVLNENSYVGGILTSRLGAESTRNVMYGWDGIFRLFGQDYLTLNWAQSFEPGEDASVGPMDRSLARAHWQRRGVDGFTYAVDLTRSGSAFEPGLGFLFRRNYTKGVGEVGYGRRFGPESRWLRQRVSVAGTAFRRGSDGTLETATLMPEWQIETKTGHRFTARLTTTVDDLDDVFDLSDDVGVAVGRYTFTSGELAFRQSLGDLLRTNVGLEYGGFYDGTRVAADVSTTWNQSMHLELQGTYRIEDIDFGSRAQRFRAHIARLRAEARLDTRISGATFVQYSSAGNAVSVNVRLRYNPREGDNLYIVWNEGLVTQRNRFDPVRPLSDRRTLVVKYSKTFTLGL